MVRETGGDVAVKSMVGSCVGSLKSFQRGYFYDCVALSAYLPTCVCGGGRGEGGVGGSLNTTRSSYPLA